MTKNNFILSIYIILFSACASWPWKYTEQHGRSTSGSIFDQISSVVENTNQVNTNNDRCAFVPDAGLCKCSFENYFFNQETQKCDSFNWGGCNGLIPFETLQECTDTCE